LPGHTPAGGKKQIIGKVTLNVFDKLTPGKKLPGAKYKLVDKKTGKEVGVPGVSNDKGIVEFPDVPVGDFEVVEVTPPGDGYEPIVTKIPVSVTERNLTPSVDSPYLKPEPKQHTLPGPKVDQRPAPDPVQPTPPPTQTDTPPAPQVPVQPQPQQPTQPAPGGGLANTGSGSSGLTSVLSALMTMTGLTFFFGKRRRKRENPAD
ncbi:MAG: SpaA isopeptide-forming pilin-related protein, partial [Microbacteriaceae bacterium]|nr:SpaA isopeptide-forming pilin-related protein [Microbacteriaceae bacterium]